MEKVTKTKAQLEKELDRLVKRLSTADDRKAAKIMAQMSVVTNELLFR